MAGFSMWQGPMPHSHEAPGGGERVEDAWLDGSDVRMVVWAGNRVPGFGCLC